MYMGACGGVGVACVSVLCVGMRLLRSQSSAHALIQVPILALTHPVTHPPTDSLTHPLTTHSLTHSLTFVVWLHGRNRPTAKKIDQEHIALGGGSGSERGMVGVRVRGW